MRQKIGIFIGEVTSEYQEVILKAIFRKTKELNYDVFVFCNFGAYGNNVLYAEGEKSSIRIPDISRLDGIIVGEDTFDIDGMENELFILLRQQAECPVVLFETLKRVFIMCLWKMVRQLLISQDILSKIMVSAIFAL